MWSSAAFSAERAAEAVDTFRERYEPIGKFENMAAPGMADSVRPAEGPGLCAGPGLLQAGELVRAHL